MLRIATWNVNSLRVRMPHLEEWLETQKPEVVALQETKMEDTVFPSEALKALGYEVIFSGQKTYNGVALLSRYGFEKVEMNLPGVDDAQKRVIGATIQGIRIWNFYVPNGASVGSEKYAYKLKWLEDVKNALALELKHHPAMVLMGDFNIAPEDKDVHDPSAWEGSVLVSPEERAALAQWMKLGFKDCFREKSPTDIAYSWWDYRLNAFRRNMGLRIDHIFATPSLAAQCQHCWIDKEPRQWERPSDHAPVIAEFKDSLF